MVAIADSNTWPSDHNPDSTDSGTYIGTAGWVTYRTFEHVAVSQSDIHDQKIKEQHEEEMFLGKLARQDQTRRSLRTPKPLYHRRMMFCDKIEKPGSSTAGGEL